MAQQAQGHTRRTRRHAVQQILRMGNHRCNKISSTHSDVSVTTSHLDQVGEDAIFKAAKESAFRQERSNRRSNGPSPGTLARHLATEGIAPHKINEELLKLVTKSRSSIIMSKLRAEGIIPQDAAPTALQQAAPWRADGKGAAVIRNRLLDDNLVNGKQRASQIVKGLPAVPSTKKRTTSTDTKKCDHCGLVMTDEQYTENELVCLGCGHMVVQ